MTPKDQRILCGAREVDGVQLRERAARAASSFAALGLKQGDTVAVMLRKAA